MIEIMIVGPAGSGKTTIARKIKDLCEAEGKKVLLNDENRGLTVREEHE